MEEVTRSFRAMNTDILAIVGCVEDRLADAESALGRIEEVFANNEAVMSRFVPESELSRLNESAGNRFAVSPLLFSVLAEAIEAARSTGGVFDPTVLRDLVAAGYDRSFELIDAMALGRKTEAASERRCSWRDIQMDATSSTVTLPKGCGIDLGGIGKGWTVDQAAKALLPFRNFAVDAGGDIYAAGSQVDGEPWTVGIADPFDPDRDLAVLAVRDRAVATSTTSRRRWMDNKGRLMHHLIDPRTGMPGAADVVSATVVARATARAEVVAKTALLLGSAEGEAFLQAQEGTDWMLVLANGEIRRSAGLPEVQYAG